MSAGRVRDLASPPHEGFTDIAAIGAGRGAELQDRFLSDVQAVAARMEVNGDRARVACQNALALLRRLKHGIESCVECYRMRCQFWDYSSLLCGESTE